MDDYTKKTKAYLEKRFRMVDKNGFYQAHQPIYGYRKGPCDSMVEGGYISQYSRTFRILTVMNKLMFKTFLDVGGCEGYTSNIVKNLFNVDVASCDLSYEANLRAREFYGINSFVMDVHSIPVMDHYFDVVLCSEVLEHVPDPKKVIKELLRVTKKALILTTPRASSEKEKKEYFEGGHSIDKYGYKEHRHLFYFTKKDIIKLIPKKYYMVIHGIRSKKYLFRLMKLVEGAELSEASFKKWNFLFLRFYNLSKKIFSKTGLRAVRFIIMMDNFLVTLFPEYTEDFIVVIRKDKFTKNIFSNSSILDYILLKNSVKQQKIPNKTFDFNIDMLNYLFCPSCKGHLIFKRKNLFCKNCRKKYFVKKGIPILLN